MTEQYNSLRGAMPKSSASSATARMRLQRNDLGAVRMASAADLVGDAADFEGMAWACWSATKLPTPAMRTRTPSSRNSRSARFAVMRDTPKDLTMSFSDGTRAEVPHLPEPMLSRICRFTWRYSGCNDAFGLFMPRD